MGAGASKNERPSPEERQLTNPEEALVNTQEFEPIRNWEGEVSQYWIT